MAIALPFCADHTLGVLAFPRSPASSVTLTREGPQDSLVSPEFCGHVNISTLDSSDQLPLHASKRGTQTQCSCSFTHGSPCWQLSSLTPL